MFSFFRNGKQTMTLAEITEHLNMLRIPLVLVFTPINFEQERKRFLESDEYNPQFKYKLAKNTNSEVFKRLASVKGVSNVDPRISEFYVRLIQEKKQASDLMHAVGNNDLVTTISKARFGTPTAKQFRNANRLLRHRVEKYNLIEKEEILNDRWLHFDEIKNVMEMFLKELGLGHWQVGASKRIVRNGVRTLNRDQMIKMDINIKKRATNLRKTIVHEIGTHVLRAYNGSLSGYEALGKSGLGDYLDVEEGLAMWNEEKANVLSYGMFRKKVLNLWMGYIGEDMSFRELFNVLNAIVPRLDAFDLVYRMKRGLSDTSQPGMYYKDIVYLRGFWRIRRKLHEDSSLYNKLYAGKIGFKQVSWVDDGLIPQAKVLPDFDLYNRIFEKAGI